jgi:large subunit ribosomal protein L13
MKQQKTRSMKLDEVERQWFVVDASGQTLGRLASKVAAILRGKHKAIYTPHVDTGDFVIIINADRITVTGNKPVQKIYYRHSGYPGGLKAETFASFVQRAPEKVISKAVEGMLPHCVLGRQMLGKLKVYAGSEHPHGAQQPVELKF